MKRKITKIFFVETFLKNKYIKRLKEITTILDQSR